MALKTKSSDTDESSDDEDFKMKSYIIRQFKKFMKNAIAKGFDKDHKQSSFGHMKQECPTYLKTIGKSQALATALSDTEPEDESDDNDDEGISNAFTATVDPTDGVSETVDDEEDLTIGKSKALVAILSNTELEDDSDDNDDKGILNAFTATVDPTDGDSEIVDDEEDLVDSKLATKKLSDVEHEREEISIKFDEANQAIGALRFENNFLAEKTKKLTAHLGGFVESPSPSLKAFENEDDDCDSDGDDADEDEDEDASSSDNDEMTASQ
ncbi:NAD-dependent protein deacetylase HST1-like [Quercus robur]|uniref:NAD-dependent protein deacetylase HST1-like n=1 Tax=Quercus robur TaxID=38942 RepID=UPI002161A39E|nr:NAD-dependent protein deacetylase HST1-like [Quercus robur]